MTTAAALLTAGLLSAHPRANVTLARRIVPVLVIEATKAGVDPALFVSLAWNESGLNPWAENPRTGARGLLQLAPVHWSTMRPVARSWSPSSNARVGAKILRRHLDECPTEAGAVGRYHGRATCEGDAWSRQVVAFAAELRKALAVKS